MSKYDSFSNQYELGSTMEGGKGIYLNTETMRVILQPSEGGMHSVEDIHRILESEREIWERRIAKLEEANATLRSVVEAQSEKLGEARGFVRRVAGDYVYGLEEVQLEDYKRLVAEAQELAKAWEGEKQEAEAVE